MELKIRTTLNVLNYRCRVAVCKALRLGMTDFQIAGVAANALFELGAEELEGPR
jgi:hypothetical protein